MNKIVIIDTGSGNILSLKRAIEMFHNDVVISEDSKTILFVKCVFMPTRFFSCSIISSVYFNFLFSLSEIENQTLLPLFKRPSMEPEFGQ